MTTQPKQLGRYTILNELGRGAIGAVHAARDPVSGANVALKSLDPALLGAADAKLAALFLKNARSAARLRHASIVQVHDAGEAGGTAWVAMELVQGDSLRRALAGRPLPIARAVRIFDDIASALAYSHEEGMVHRGVRPSNIFVLPSGAAKIGDFGTGQVGEAALPYMSPEQVRGQPVDARSDLFSLGAVFYEMLTGRAAFEGKSAQEIKQAILHAEPVPPSELNPLVPDALDHIVLSLLTLRPDGRPANARILLRDLHRIEEGLGMGTSIEAVAKPIDVAPAKAGAHASIESPQPALMRPAPPPRIPRPNAFSEAGDFGGFRPGAAEADVLPERPMATDHEDFDHRRAMMERGARRERPSGSRAGMLTALGMMLAAVGVGFGVYMYVLSGSVAPTPAASLKTAPPEISNQPVAAFAPWQSTRPKAVAEAPKQPEPAVSPVKEPAVAPAKAAAAPTPALNTPQPIAPPPVAKVLAEPALSAEASPSPPPVAPAKAEAQATAAPAGSGLTLPRSIAEAPKPAVAAPSAPEPEKASTVAAAAPQKAPRAAPPAAAAPKAQPARKAQLFLAVSPGGEVYINGEHQGTAPATTTFELEPGMHQVEIRSGSRKPYVTYMTVEPGEQRRIRHDFSAKPSIPPG